MHLKCVRVTPNQKFGVATLHRSSLSRELQGLKAALQHLHPLPTNSLPPLSSSLRPNPSLGPDASASGSPLGYRRPDDSIFPRGMPSTVFPGGSDGILPPPGMSNHVSCGASCRLGQDHAYLRGKHRHYFPGITWVCSPL